MKEPDVRITRVSRERKRIGKTMEFNVPRTPRGKITKKGWQTIFKALEALNLKK